MSPSYSPAGAAEFPNDNPDLHGGARWVCLATRGAARALLRPPARDAAPPPASETRRVAVEQGPLDAPESARPPSPSERFKGPLQLDLNRIVLLHRVENIPPPPDFVFEPFISSRPAQAPATEALAPIEPVACRAVDIREERRRVARGWRVDIAPCLSIEPSPPASESKVESEASPPALPASTTIPQESGRRLARGRGRVAARALSPLPDSDEVSRAIHELEAAFGAPALHSPLNEGAGVSGWRANGA